ncbi:formate/nitrite transporter family protein [Halocatena halophila]|uniref:formate/nitrite transporter family protein n=1 Tax=Halocatena halophila TaxID=2814576 RepID=UPI002ED3180B
MDEPEDESEDAFRDVFERSRSGAPAAGRVVRDRFSADEVFQRIVAAADEEITSGSRELFFSALAAGFAITITFLLYSSMTAQTGGDPVLSTILYPLGFIYIIIGNYQLYTENTLPPVALTLDRLASMPALLRHWFIVLIGNFTGGAMGAMTLTWGGVFSPGAAQAALEHAETGVHTPVSSLFFKAAFAGLIVAGVVWIVYAVQDTISRLVVVYLAFLAIPMGNLFHVVVSFTEMIYLVLGGHLALSEGVIHFVLPVLLGNTFGGIVLVTVVNYFQTTEHRLESARFDGANRQLSLREWTLGGFVGRSYVSMIDTAGETVRDDDAYRILLPIYNPRTETRIAKVAAIMATNRLPATIHTVHIVESHHGGYDQEQYERIIERSTEQMTHIRSTIEEYDIPYETSTIVSHRSFEEIYDAANRENSNLIVMGWDENRPRGRTNTERTFDELTGKLTSDIVIVRDRGHDPDSVLVPTSGGPSSDLNAEVALAFETVTDANISLLHVVDGPEHRTDGQAFLDSWSSKHGLESADLIVDTDGDVERAIKRRAPDYELILIGASEEGLLTRLVTDSLYSDVSETVQSSVILAERPSGRTLLEKLLGES